MNHPVTPPAKRRTVHPTAAEIRRAEKASTRPDGTIDAGAFGAAIAQPLGIRRRMALRQLAAITEELARTAPGAAVEETTPASKPAPRRRAG